MDFNAVIEASSQIFFLALTLVLIALFFAIRSAINKKAYRDRLARIESGKYTASKPKAALKSFWEIFWGDRKLGLDSKIREIEAQQKQRLAGHKKTTLTTRMRQAGVGWSVFSYFLISLICAGVFSIGFLAQGFNPIVAFGFGLSLGMMTPHFYIKFLMKRRLKKFNREFPNALDILVRGLRSGLPMVDCLRIAARDTQDPVRSEFQKVIDDQALGVPTHEALIKLAGRVPSTEVNFFAIVVKIQNTTGGSLSESISNLANTLRERRKLEGKIVSMSQEAKSSAAIIGSLPFFVSGALYFINPGYLMQLVESSTGIMILIGSGLWMLLGIAVMRKMIDFEV